MPNRNLRQHCEPRREVQATATTPIGAAARTSPRQLLQLTLSTLVVTHIFPKMVDGNTRSRNESVFIKLFPGFLKEAGKLKPSHQAHEQRLQ